MNRLTCTLLITGTIALGLLSRQASFVPAATGDALYALMMFFIMRFLFIDKRSAPVAAASLALCFAVELSQLYHAPWINMLRSTLPGKLILGQGFLWTDFPAYIVGTVAGLIIEKLVFKKD